jgi:PAS domain S-box-containing protein
MGELDFRSEAIIEENKRLKNELEKLQKTAQWLEIKSTLLLKYCNEPVLFFKKNTCIDCNDKALELFNCSSQYLVDQHIEQISTYKQDDGTSSAECYEQIINSYADDTISFHWNFNKPDLSLLQVQATMHKVFEASEKYYMLRLLYVSNNETLTSNYDEKLKTVAGNVPVLMKMSDESNQFYFFSHQWLEFTGRSPEQEQNGGWYENIHPEDVNIIKLKIEAAQEVKQNYEVQYRLIRHNGEARWMLESGVPFHDDNNSFKGYVSFAVDITERKNTEEQSMQIESTRSSEMQFQRALNNVNLIAATLSPTGTIRYCNQFFCKLTGWQPHEAIGKSWFELVATKEDVEERKRYFIDFVDSGSLLKSFIRNIYTKAGEKKIIRFNAVILNSVPGGVSGTTIIGEDITDKVRVVSALEESTSQLQDLFENANDLIQVFTLDGKLIFVNQAWKRTLGYSDLEIRDMTIRDIIHPDSMRSTIRYLQRILMGETFEKFETEFITKHKKKIHLTASVNCRFENGKPIAFRGILYDITDKVRAEKAQRLYYSIATLATQSTNLRNLYDNIHKELSQLVDTKNFYISLTKDKKYIHFVYYLDEHYGENVNTGRRKIARGLTEYAMHMGKPMCLYEEQIKFLAEEKAIEIYGPLPKVWLGVPLKLNQQITGVIAIQSYKDRYAYNEKDLELLDFISGQIALSIQRKQDEEKINSQTARLNAIFESSTHLIWSINRKMELTSHNQNYAYAVQEHYDILPRLNGDRLSSKVRARNTDYQQFWKEKYQHAFEGEPQHFETCLTTKAGQTIWREIFLNPIYHTDGHIEEVSGIAHDITEKKQSELALRTSEEKFRNIFESFQDVYFRTDANGIITMISPSVQELCGYKPEEIIGKKITEFYIYNVKRKEALKELWLKGSILNFEVPIVTSDGAMLESICNIRLIIDDKAKPRKLLGLEGVAKDITELKKVSEEALRAKEVAEKSLKVKEQFLANMSHEIRTPMNGIIGVLDLISDTRLDDIQREYVYTIKRSSETLLHILNDILDISKIEAGKMQLRKTTISLERTIEKLFALFQQQAAAKGISLTWATSEDVPQYIKADETRLIQILSNLTSNAIKFTEEGGVVVRISSTPIKSSKHKIKIEVQDSGIGISEENKALLFDNFSQLDNSSTKSYAGTGLGLVISKELSRLMDGDIGVESKPGIGSTFWFTFEAREATASSVNQSLDEGSETRMYRFIGDVPDVLIVDDNMVNRKVAGEILKKYGCVVDTAADGFEAIDKVKSHNYDLVLMDIQMPDMDGITATRNIRALNLERTPPIVAMTAYSMQGDDVKFMEAGLDDYLSKPIKSKLLINKVRQWVKKEAIPVEDIIEPGPTVSAQPEKSIINKKIILGFKKMIGDEMTLETYQDFVTETAELLEECNNSLNLNEYNNILSILHTLKGSAGTLGIERVEHLARSIEANLKTGKDATLKQDLKLLNNAYIEFKTNYINCLNISN